MRDGEVGYIKRGPFLHSSLPLCDQSHVEIGNFTTFLCTSILILGVNNPWSYRRIFSHTVKKCTVNLGLCSC